MSAVLGTRQRSTMGKSSNPSGAPWSLSFHELAHAASWTAFAQGGVRRYGRCGFGGGRDDRRRPACCGGEANVLERISSAATHTQANDGIPVAITRWGHGWGHIRQRRNGMSLSLSNFGSRRCGSHQPSKFNALPLGLIRGVRYLKAATQSTAAQLRSHHACDISASKGCSAVSELPIRFFYRCLPIMNWGHLVCSCRLAAGKAASTVDHKRGSCIRRGRRYLGFRGAEA
jgi:hypothetical protein